MKRWHDETAKDEQRRMGGAGRAAPACWLYHGQGSDRRNVKEDFNISS